MPEAIFEELEKLPQVEAIALGGSRAGKVFDLKSDYDVYVYVTGAVPEQTRREILKKYCSCLEIGNHFWEYEDNCTLNSGIDIDLLYRNLDGFMREIDAVVNGCEAHNGYTTCLWHNVRTCKILFDRSGRLAEYQRRYDVPYPAGLKKNIIERNMKLICRALPAYTGQIAKAVKRGDFVSINHRVAELLASYFDVIFALNEQTHPGEKRLIQLCMQNCRKLPADFEKNLNDLFAGMFSGNPDSCMEPLERMTEELERIVETEGF